MDPTIDLEWHSPAKRYLERLGLAEWLGQRNAIKGRVPKSFRYSPSPYHRALIDCLNRNDEEGFKALKGLEGYASAVGV